jgi:hypothetical protein
LGEEDIVVPEAGTATGADEEDGGKPCKAAKSSAELVE